MYFIGDIHGKWDDYFNLIDILPNSIQLGDFGFGFRKTPNPWNVNHKFIRGNHDDPNICIKHPNYLGEYGVTPENIFYISGAYSIDKKWRLQYEAKHNKKIYWDKEEISSTEYRRIYKLYNEKKPKIVISHDCPNIALRYMAKGKKEYPNVTSDILLQNLFEMHKPKIWIYGHYHISFDKVVKGVRFKCLDELEVFRGC